MLKISVSEPGETGAAAPPTTATIIAFPAARPRTPRFSPSDRAILARSAQDGSLPHGVSVVLTDDCEFGEYASFTRDGNSWSEWNVAPQDGLLALWSGRNGKDLGKFDSMHCVFGALDRALSGKSASPIEASSGRAPCSRSVGDAGLGCSCATLCARVRLAS